MASLTEIKGLMELIKLGKAISLAAKKAAPKKTRVSISAYTLKMIDDHLDDGGNHFSRSEIIYIAVYEYFVGTDDELFDYAH